MSAPTAPTTDIVAAHRLLFNTVLRGSRLVSETTQIRS
jgi:hypothetical protein